MNPNPSHNTTLHDPLRDLAPGGTHGFHADPRLALLGALLLLLIASVIRLRRTDFLDPEHPVRRDMARLLAVVWGGLAVEWLRSRFDLATPGFWIASLALLPFVIGTAAFGLRLFRAYREPEDVLPAPPPIPKSASESRPQAAPDSRPDTKPKSASKVNRR